MVLALHNLIKSEQQKHKMAALVSKIILLYHRKGRCGHKTFFLCLQT